jgi:hypothetical protein
LVVSVAEEAGGFGEKRSDDDPSDTWQGLEDLDVTRLVLPPLPSVAHSQAVGEFVQLGVALG